MLRHLELKKEIKIIKVINYCTGDGNLLKKYRAIWTKIEDLINIAWKVLPVYDNRYIKSKIKTYGDKVYSNFRGLNMQEHDIESESLSHFYRLFACIQKQILQTQVCLDNVLTKCKQTNDKLSWLKSFWRADVINDVLRRNWYKRRKWSY